MQRSMPACLSKNPCTKGENTPQHARQTRPLLTAEQGNHETPFLPSKANRYLADPIRHLEQNLNYFFPIGLKVDDGVRRIGQPPPVPRMSSNTAKPLHCGSSPVWLSQWLTVTATSLKMNPPVPVIPSTKTTSRCRHSVKVKVT